MYNIQNINYLTACVHLLTEHYTDHSGYHKQKIDKIKKYRVTIFLVLFRLALHSLIYVCLFSNRTTGMLVNKLKPWCIVTCLILIDPNYRDSGKQIQTYYCYYVEFVYCTLPGIYYFSAVTRVT